MADSSTAVDKKTLTGLFIYCIGAMVANMTMGLVAYIIMSYPGSDPTIVSQVMTIPSLIGMVFAFFVGSLMKKIQPKFILLFCHICLFLYGMAFLFIGGKGSPWLLVVCSGLAGFNQGAMNTLLAVLLREAVPDDKKRSSLLGILMATMNAGGVIFTIVGGVIAAANGGANWQNAYYLFFIVALCIVLEFIFLPNRAVAPAPAGAPADAPKAKNTAKVPGIVWAVSIHYFFFFLFMYIYGLNVSTYVISYYQLGTSVESGIATSLVTAGGVIAGLVFGPVFNKLKNWTGPVALSLMSIGMACALFITTNVIGVYIAGFLCGLSMMVMGSYVMMRLGEFCPDQDVYGKAMSIYSGFMNAGMCVAIYIIAFLTQLFFGNANDIHGKFILGTVGGVIILLTSIPIYIGKKKAAAKPEVEAK